MKVKEFIETNSQNVRYQIINKGYITLKIIQNIMI